MPEKNAHGGATGKLRNARWGPDIHGKDFADGATMRGGAIAHGVSRRQLISLIHLPKLKCAVTPKLRASEM